MYTKFELRWWTFVGQYSRFPLFFHLCGSGSVFGLFGFEFSKLQNIYLFIWIRIHTHVFSSHDTQCCGSDPVWRDPDPSVKQIFLMFHFVQYMLFYGKLNWTRAKYSLWFYDNMFRIFPGFDLERHLSLLKFLIICGIFFYSLQQSAGILQVLTFLKNLCCQTWSLTREQFTPEVQLPLSEQCHY